MSNSMQFVYQALINGEKEISISAEELKALDIADLGDEGFHAIRDRKGYQVQVLSADYANKEFVLRVGNEEVHVKLKDAVDLQVEKMGYERNSKQHSNKIVAPMPGLVLEVRVKTDDQVVEGDPLVILEAMKMENVLSAPRDGTIAEVHVAKGDSVDKLQLLVRLE